MTDRPPTPDQLATLLHNVLDDVRGDYDTVHNRQLAGKIAARLRAAGVTLTQPQPDAGLREALEWIAAKADGFCPECEGGVLIDPEDGTPEPCFDSIHVISAKAKVALRSNPAAPRHDVSANCQHGDHDDCAGMVECEDEHYGLHDCACPCGHPPTPTAPKEDDRG